MFLAGGMWSKRKGTSTVKCSKDQSPGEGVPIQLFDQT